MKNIKAFNVKTWPNINCFPLMGDQYNIHFTGLLISIILFGCFFVVFLL